MSAIRAEAHQVIFSPEGTQTKKGEFAGMGDFEVVAFLVIV